ncbi:DUF5683 domain-containing protein [Fodinibius sp. Rm-B-1B1-1]|uniref:DUF5683 domain-containing protein n=1 Tax=Fodinibius alkaliphilus TaxID=3140241 RepID=UPI00315B0EA8
MFVFLGILGGASHVQSKQNKQDIDIDKLKPQINYAQSDRFYEPLQQKPGWALLSSAIVPGSGQAANKKWIRAGLYFLAEAAMIGIYLKSSHDARLEEQRYERFANNNWSVINYAKWLVEYHEQNNLSNSYIDELEQEVENINANYQPDSDWNKIDIELLRNVEQNTPFVYPEHIGNNFSHVMPKYGSQQYYELISKYYQYGPGWNDFTAQYQLQWDGSNMPKNFLLGAQLAQDYNDTYRLAGNMVSFMILNHIVSAFDAYLTVKLKNRKLEADTNLLNIHRAFLFKFHF